MNKDHISIGNNKDFKLEHAFRKRRKSFPTGNRAVFANVLTQRPRNKMTTEILNPNMNYKDNSLKKMNLFVLNNEIHLLKISISNRQWTVNNGSMRMVNYKFHTGKN